MPVVIDADICFDMVCNLLQQLRTNYVFPDVAEQICAGIQKHLENGEYTDITEGEFIAYALTMHLQEINQDEHLWVRWHEQPLPGDEGQLRLNPEWQGERQLEARLDNYGIHRVERLPGNVGYIDIRRFHRPAWAGDTVVAAMNFVCTMDALIIDLRKCTGGYPDMLVLIASYLFGYEPVHLFSIYWRDEDITQQYWTLPSVPGKRFLGKPVYVLISKITFSAGETFAYILQARQRATLIGENTDGGAHPGASFRIHPHFEAFIPIGRSIDPIRGADFEGVGVFPHILSFSEQALEIAHRMALEAVREQIGEPACEPAASLKQEIQVALSQINSQG